MFLFPFPNVKLCDPTDFDYFLDLYESEFHSKQKWNMLIEATKTLGGEPAFARYYDELKERVVGKSFD